MLAIVLDRKNWRESDQMISLYTREQGKVEALVKGIKKITSKNSANLGILSLVEITIASGREVEHLTKVRPVKIFKNIYSDFDKIWLAQYVVKLADQNVLSAERDEKIFNLLLSFLEFLDSAVKINSLNLATAFIFKFWHCLGFGDSAHASWLEENWEQINKKSAVKVYEHAKVFAEQHSGHPLAKFVESDRIMA